MQTPTPTEPGIPNRAGTFATLTEALDYGATGVTGLNYHDGRGTLTEVLAYRDLADQARALGARMYALGLEPGDRVGLVAETEADFARAFMACLYAGLIPCPMPLPAAFGARDAYRDQIQRIALVADSAAVIVAEAYAARVEDALRDLPGLTKNLFVGPLGALPPAGPVDLPTPHPDGLAYLQFSSGTTSAPKGIAITHRALAANLRGMICDALMIGSHDRAVSWLPYYHDMGLVGCMLVPIGAQMSADYMATRDFVRRPGLWPVMISRAKATLAYSPSFGFELAARRNRLSETLDLSSWRIAGIGGDMVKAANLRVFCDAFEPHGFDPSAFTPSYGMAEVTLSMCFSPQGSGCRTERLDLDALARGDALKCGEDAPRNREFALCGPALPGHAVEIRGGDGAALPTRRIGRVHAKGPSLMQGYYGNPAATAEVLSADGWLDTGDLGYLTEDGELVLTGRGKDLIIVNGRNIWPQDIEWTIEKQLDGIREGGVAAFGMLNGAGEGGDGEEEVTVVIECRTSQPDGRDALRSGADALVREMHGVAPNIVLSKPGRLPRTTSGKLSRAQAREIYRAGGFDL
ncbi:MAG: fatty acyl-AMP ligase [Pseudomonadota bacterium]